MASLTAKADNTEATNWAVRHNQAVAVPKEEEYGMVHMLRGWTEYAKLHLSRCESPISDDYVLGPEWQAIGEAIRGLLNGETGRLDCGTLDAFILDTMRENGFTELAGGDVL